MERNMPREIPTLYDKNIIERVQSYLEENIDKTYLNVEHMTRSLMVRYPEYTRRKFGPFKQLVKKAFHIVSKSYDLNQDQSDASSDESDLQLMETTSTPNFMSSMMNSLYNKTPKSGDATTAKAPQAEPIDIIDSSDESEEDKLSVNGKPSMHVPESNQLGKKRTHVSAQLPDSDIKHKKAKIEFNASSVLSKYNTRPMNDHMRKQLISSAFYSQNSNDSNAPLLPAGGRQSMRARKYKKELKITKSSETFQDVGGMESTLKELCELLINIKVPDVYFQLGLMPPRGLLLHGPSGCGKTLLAHAIAGQLNLAILEVPATELIAGISGESEERIREVFDQAFDNSPCVLFIDEIDAISSNRSMAQKDMERRVVSQLITCLDSLKHTEIGQSVLVIGATTRPDILDPSLRRVGRFDHEIAIHIPTRKDRKDILNIITEGLALEENIDIDKIAELTPGYVGADLLALVSRAAAIAVKRQCTERFRDLQLKRENNIDCVDLVDDEPEALTNKPESASKAPEKENLTNEVATEPSTTAASTATTEKSKIESVPNIEINDVVAERATPSVKEDSAVAENNITDDTPKDKEKPEETKIEEIKKPSSKEPYEPTLFELTNWLDNPPEDFSDAQFSMTFDDFYAAIKVVQPSAKREGFITVPDVTWDDIGSLQNIRDELKLAVLAPVKYPEKLERLGLTAPSGVLLCGPPGCGKTLLAKAIANEAGINFISVKGPELMNMYVGESERAVRACFQRARNSSPCVIFFDEFDSLCPKRSDGNEGGSGTRIVNQLLTEMDGVEERKGVYILAATNRPDIIDPAIMRPGRLDTILYVGLPNKIDRVEILRATTKNGTRPVIDDDLLFEKIANKTEGYTGADLAGLVKQASMSALRESILDKDSKIEDLCVRHKHFDEAILQFRPSVSAQDRIKYEKLRLKYAAPPQSN